MNNYKLFTAMVRNGDDDTCVELPGFSHIIRDKRTIVFFAKNRSDAANQLGRFLGINYPCSLSDGRSCRQLLSEGIASSLDRFYGKVAYRACG